MAYELIETIEVTAQTNSITLANIPQDGKDLHLKMSLRGNANQNNFLYVRFNGITTSTYQNCWLRGQGGSSVGAQAYNNVPGFTNFFPGATWEANVFGNHSLVLQNYAETKPKAGIFDGTNTNDNSNLGDLYLVGCSHANTDPITTLEVYGSVPFVQYSTVSLYKTY